MLLLPPAPSTATMVWNGTDTVTTTYNTGGVIPGQDLVLAQQVSGCRRCDTLCRTRTKTVFGVGPLGPEVMFIGEAPGADEDRQGEPFVGAAGQLLTRIITAMGMKREEVFICNILRCRPPANRPPEAEEAANCSEWLHRTLELVRPKFICAMGNTPLKFLLGVSRGGIGARRARSQQAHVPADSAQHPGLDRPLRARA